MSLINADQVLAHSIGDYILQSHWMASEKTSRWKPAVVHALTYTLPFVMLTRSPWRLATIAGTHALIDRYRLARHVVAAKNAVGSPTGQWHHTATGYGEEVPPWLAVWLLIIADNIMHVVINGLVLQSTRRVLAQEGT